MKLLVGAKAGVNLKDRTGRTALLWAAEKEHKKIVKPPADVKLKD